MPDASEFPDFAVACGEEASDPTVLHDGRIVRVDELTASRHLDHQDDDLAAVAGLGVRVWRYGIPWRLTEPAPREYDWTLWDRALAACERHGLTPVVDLCHFGLPDHYPGFCDPTWVAGFARYVDAFLARYPSPMWFTPVNEPAITASASALLGAWNDRCASRTDYFVALAHVSLANLEALARVRADRNGWWIGAEGFGCPVALHPDAQPGVDALRALQQVVWDLHFGVGCAPRSPTCTTSSTTTPSAASRSSRSARSASSRVTTSTPCRRPSTAARSTTLRPSPNVSSRTPPKRARGTIATGWPSASQRRRTSASPSTSRSTGSTRWSRASTRCGSTACPFVASAGTAAAISTTGTRC